MINRCKMQDKVVITTESGSKLVCGTYDSTNIIHRIKKWLGYRYANDLILDGGLADIAEMVGDRYDYISIGVGLLLPSHDNTQLQTEVMRSQCVSKVLSTTFYLNDTITFSAQFTPPTTYSISEVGINKNATTSGDITLARETFTPFSAANGIQFTVSYSVIMMR